MSESNNTSSFLFLCRRPPFGQDRLAGMVDMLLTAATFDQQVTLIFSGEGVLNLLPGNAEAIGFKDARKALEALELYGVQDIYAEAEALELHGLQNAQLLIPVKLLNQEALQAHLADAEQVIIS